MEGKTPNGNSEMEVQQPPLAPEAPTSAAAAPTMSPDVWRLTCLTELFKKLGILDRLLAPAILLVMIIGVIIGEYAHGVQQAFNTASFQSVSIPIAVGLILMMWPILTKVQYEALPNIFSTRRIWIHVGLSIVLNWIVGPLIMLALAWATLPDLPTYRTGVILVGLARCIAMVMIWNQLAHGDGNYCAILVVINAILQIILYSPYSLLFLNVIGGQAGLRVKYSAVAISVLIYLGIPLAAGVVTRFAVWRLTSKEMLEKRFLPLFSPLAFLGLLYTILVMFALQGHHIVENIGLVFRVFVPLVLYFVIMWSSAFALVFYLSRRESAVQDSGKVYGYQMAVVQSFTAGSNNFELAIAVAIAIYGANSDQALATAIGPLVEVPVLLGLTWVSLFLGRKLKWTRVEKGTEKTNPV